MSVIDRINGTVGILAVRCDRCMLVFLAVRLMSQANICRDTVEPCREFAAFLKLFQSPEHAQEDFLVNVLRLIGAVTEPGGDGEDMPVIAINELFECTHITLPGMLNQFTIVRRHSRLRVFSLG